MYEPPERTYRIVDVRPWAAEGTDRAPQPVRTFFEHKEATLDDMRALAESFGAEFESMVQGGGRYQATIRWRGHHYDLDLEPVGQ